MFSIALPDCSYTTAKQDVTVIAMDDILFSRSSSDCQRFCDDARAFNCRSYAQLEDRCYLSGDDSVNLEGVPQPVEIGAVYKEKVCTRSKSTNLKYHSHVRLLRGMIFNVQRRVIESPNLISVLGFQRNIFVVPLSKKKCPL